MILAHQNFNGHRPASARTVSTRSSASSQLSLASMRSASSNATPPSPAPSSYSYSYSLDDISHQPFASLDPPMTYDQDRHLHSGPPPPEYGSDFSVEPLTVKNKPPQIMKIALAPAASARSYENGEIILGTLQIAPSEQVRVAALTVALEGEEVTRRAGWTHEHVLRRRMRLRAHPVAGLTPGTVLRPGMLYSFPFSIAVPDEQEQHACAHACDRPDEDRHIHVPPSLAHPADHPVPASDVPARTAHITYRLQAVLRRVRKSKRADDGSDGTVTYATTHSYVTIAPSYPAPPSALVPPPEPFRAFAEVTRRGGKMGASRRAVGVAQLTFDAHPVLPLATGSVAVLPLSLKFYPRGDAAPPTIKRLSVYIKARTVYSAGEPFSSRVSNFGALHAVQIEPRMTDVIDPSKGLDANGVPRTSPGRALPADFKEIFQTYLVSQMTTSCGFQWPAAPASVGGRAVYDAGFAVPLVMPERHERALVPTFASCYTMRDYTLAVCAEFAGSAAVLCAEVPAVLVKHAADALSNAPVPGYSLHADQCPPQLFIKGRPVSPPPSPRLAPVAPKPTRSPVDVDLLVVDAFEHKTPKPHIAAHFARP